MNGKRSAYILYLKRLLIYSAIIFIVGLLIFAIVPDGLYTRAFPFLIPFFMAVSLLVHYILLKAVDKKPAKFINQFMLTTFLKLLFYLLVMVIYALTHREDAIRFVITYFILYALYAVFEVVNILEYNKSRNNAG